MEVLEDTEGAEGGAKCIRGNYLERICPHIKLQLVQLNKSARGAG